MKNRKEEDKEIIIIISESLYKVAEIAAKSRDNRIRIIRASSLDSRII